MATPFLSRTTFEEKLVWFGLVLTYPCFLVGGLYVLGSVIGWLIVSVVLLRLFVEGRSQYFQAPVICWVWVITMLLMLVSLLVAHSDFNLGLGKTIKSSIGWAKGWALIALFILLGAILPLKLNLLCRGCAVIACHSLIFSAVSFVAFVVGLGGDLFVSPLKAIGGPGNEFFAVGFFGINPETGLPRWRFYGPWAPSAGLLACIFLVICVNEKDPYWRRMGIAGATVMCLLCQSRAGWAIFAFLLCILPFINRVNHPGVFIMGGLALTVVILLGQPVLEYISDSYQAIKNNRPESSRVRDTLARIAIQRWQDEAPIWGHGIVERGPKIVEFMPIGSHHTWYGLLFVKGWVGAISLAIPMILTAIYLAFDAIYRPISRTAIILLIIIFGYSFFENLEILVYLFWPALLWIGFALNPVKNRGD